MQQNKPLSERLLAPPWVIEEVRKLEEEIERLNSVIEGLYEDMAGEDI